MAPPVLVETPGSATANTFCTLVEASLYLSGRLNSTAFTGASADDQNTALLEACRDLSRLNSWKGRRTDAVQALSWPRDYVPDPDNPDNAGITLTGFPFTESAFTTVTYFDDDVIPDRVKEAQAELALEYLKAGTLDVAGIDPARNVQEETIDVITTRYFSPAQTATGLSRYPRVMTLIGPLLDLSGMKVVRT